MSHVVTFIEKVEQTEDLDRCVGIMYNGSRDGDEFAGILEFMLVEFRKVQPYSKTKPWAEIVSGFARNYLIVETSPGHYTCAVAGDWITWSRGHCWPQVRTAEHMRAYWEKTDA